MAMAASSIAPHSGKPWIWAAVAGVVGYLVGAGTSTFREVWVRYWRRSPVVRLDNVRGRALKRAAFTLQEGTVFLNNGSFGSVPKVVLETQDHFRAELERNPDFFLRWSGGRVGTGGLDPRWVTAANLVSEFVGGNAGEVVFVKNATAGVNAVLRSVKLQPGDAMLITCHTYGAVANAAADVCARNGYELVVWDIPIGALSDEEHLCSLLSDQLRVNSHVKLAVLDHVASPVSVVMPVARFARVCHASGCRLLVDGAHAPGTVVPLRMHDLDVDFYVANLHKWMFCPKGTAFLWAPRHHHDEVHPVVVSHYYQLSFHERFFMQGTLDDTSFLTVPRAFAFIDELGGAEAVLAYNQNLLSEATQMLVERWGTDLLTPLSCCSTMVCVRMPLHDCFSETELRQNGATIGSKLFRDLWEKYNTICPVIITTDFGTFLGHAYARISAQVYNELSDYEHLADAVLHIREDVLKAKRHR